MKRGHEATNISPRPATTGLVLSANRYGGGRVGNHESMCQAVSHRVFKFFVVDEVGIAATGIWLLGFPNVNVLPRAFSPMKLSSIRFH